ncbi:peptidase inhibitor family I36 protein [Streptomyces filamentosus]|uniref:peptidase inhibitor family I36 protein n=1 Tax=Streptomyces filamentosus TaxID=67294 RepID=UPI0036F0F1C8
MNFIKKSLTTVALSSALVGGAFVTPAAAADPNTCPSGKVCGWSGINRTGTRTVLSVTPGCMPFKTARSVSNQTSYRIDFWKITLGCGHGTKVVSLRPRTYADDPGTMTGIEVWGR